MSNLYEKVLSYLLIGSSTHDQQTATVRIPKTTSSLDQIIVSVNSQPYKNQTCSSIWHFTFYN
jgi:hypothetical protein